MLIWRCLTAMTSSFIILTRTHSLVAVSDRDTLIPINTDFDLFSQSSAFAASKQRGDLNVEGPFRGLLSDFSIPLLKYGI